MKPAAPSSNAYRRTIVLCLVLGLIAVVATVMQPRGGVEDGTVPAPAMAATKAGERKPASVDGKIAEGLPAPLPASSGIPAEVTALPGHEGHGDECAQCRAERKLVVYREDFAQLHFSRIRDQFELDEKQSGEALEACRRFARVVLTEWSFSDAKPRLPEDATLEARQREILGPLLETLSRKPGDTL